MANKSSFEDRLERLSQKASPEQPHPPAPRSNAPWGAIGGRIVMPLCGLVALAAFIFVVTSDTKANDVRKGPFDLAGSLKSNMTEQELNKMYTDPAIKKAVANAPSEGAAEMMRLLLSN